jgi:hypothetical protein
VDVQVSHSLSLTGLVLVSFSAPRLVLMRCMTRCEVVVDRSSVYFKSFRASVFQVIDVETHKCPIGKVPIVIFFSSSNQSLLSKACLFSVKGSRPRLAHS